LRALVERLRAQHDVSLAVKATSVRGGHGRALTALQSYLENLSEGQEPVADLLLVAQDCNCQGYAARKAAIDKVVAGYANPVLCAIPEPHVERWFLLDPAAFKAVFGKGCPAPDRKCERDRYKMLFAQAIQDAGITPLAGGLEFVENLVQAMHFERMEKSDPSFGKLLKSQRIWFKQWKQA
jgi:hypothetical protein